MKKITLFFVASLLATTVFVAVPVRAQGLTATTQELALLAQLSSLIENLRLEIAAALQSKVGEYMTSTASTSSPPTATTTTDKITLPLYAPTTPAAPSNLVASATSTQVQLSWQDNSSNELGFLIERSTNGAIFSNIGTTTVSVVSYSDFFVLPSATYWYRVKAYNKVGQSAFSNTVIVTVPPGQNAPNPPSNLTAASSLTQVQLNWVDNFTNELNFNVERSTNGINFNGIASTSANVTYYVDTPPATTTPNATYWYRVSASNQYGTSAYSNVVQISMQSLPNPPTNLTAAASSTTNLFVNLVWQDNSNNELGFLVERSANGITFLNIATTSASNASTTSYTDFLVVPNTTYWYRVRAFNQSGNSAYSNTVQVTTSPSNLPPNAPSNLTATSSATAVQLNWQDNSANELAFDIERGFSTSTLAHLATTTADVNVYIDSTVQSATTYYYRVRAWNSYGYSAYSNIVDITTPATFTQGGSPRVRPLGAAPFLPAPLPAFTQTFQKGSRGKEVEALQAFLRALGFFPKDAPIVGYFGDTTKKALQNFQQNYKIVLPDSVFGFGEFGPASRAKANEILRSSNSLLTGVTSVQKLPGNIGEKFTLAVVPNLNDKDVSIIDTYSNQVIATIPLTDRPIRVAMTKNGKYAYILSQRYSSISKAKIFKIDLNTFALANVIDPSLKNGSDIEVSPNDQFLVTTDRDNTVIPDEGRVYIIDIATDTILKSFTICTFCVPGEIVFDPTSQSAYVGVDLISASQANYVQEIDLATQTLGKVFPMQYDASGPIKSNIVDLRFANQPFLLGLPNSCINYFCSVRRHDVSQGTYVDLGNTQPSSVNFGFDMELTNNKNTVILGDTVLSPSNLNDDFLKLIDVNSGNIIQASFGEEDIQHLTYGRSKNQLWGICLGYGSWPCRASQSSIVGFDLDTMQNLTVIGTSVSYGFPSLSQNEKYFYAPDYYNDRIVVVDTSYPYSVGWILVGDNPRGIYMQGDNSVKEAP